MPLVAPPPILAEADWAFVSDGMTVALRAFLILWTFALGASLGSFLNVVVYRLPAGLSLSRPKSRCPRCGTPIRKGDNLPVVGWLRLRGRCRACGLPIAKRYPLVEATCGTLLAVLFTQTVLLGGVNLPVAETLYDAGRWTRDIRSELVAACGYLFLGQLVLFAAGLIALDGHRVPVKLWGAALLLTVIFPAVWPGLRFDPPAWNWTVEEPAGGGRWSLTEGAGGITEVLGLPFAADWQRPADAILSGLLLAGFTGLVGRLTAIAGSNGPADGWNLVIVAGLAGAWWGVRAGGLGLAAGGAVWLLSPIGYGFGLVRGRTPGAFWAAAGTVTVPLVWFVLPRLIGRAGPVATGLCVSWFLLLAGCLMDWLFFDATGSRAEVDDS